MIRFILKNICSLINKYNKTNSNNLRKKFILYINFFLFFFVFGFVCIYLIQLIIENMDFTYNQLIDLEKVHEAETVETEENNWKNNKDEEKEEKPKEVIRLHISKKKIVGKYYFLIDPVVLGVGVVYFSTYGLNITTWILASIIRKNPDEFLFSTLVLAAHNLTAIISSWLLYEINHNVEVEYFDDDENNKP